MTRFFSPASYQCACALVLMLALLHNRADADGAPVTKTPDPDVLLFNDGEKLIGKFERSNGKSVVFKSDMAGEVTVDWSKIKELHSGGRFAVAEKGMRFGRRHDFLNKVPQGEIAMNNQKIDVTPVVAAAQPKEVPVANASYVIDQETFLKSLQRPSIFEYWKGVATFGSSLVLATQNDRSYTSSVVLTRSIPTEPWMDPENRTVIGFSSSYGELTQPGQPLVKTSIFHANAERDEFFSPRLFVFVEGVFDHNFSQGLDLQQTFGSGLGWTVVKGTDEELNLRAEATYVHQQFQDASQNQELFGSNFAETYNRKFRHNIVFAENLAFAPSWNNTQAYSSTGQVTLSIPVFKRIGLTIGALDTFLNNPSPGFRKNSFQFTNSLSYTLP